MLYLLLALPASSQVSYELLALVFKLILQVENLNVMIGLMVSVQKVFDKLWGPSGVCSLTDLILSIYKWFARGITTL